MTVLLRHPQLDNGFFGFEFSLAKMTVAFAVELLIDLEKRLIALYDYGIASFGFAPIASPFEVSSSSERNF